MSESQAASQKAIPQPDAGAGTNSALAHRVASRSEWLAERSALLAREKEFTKLGDQLSAERRALPWVRIEKEYVFDGPSGKVTLGQLFNGRSQLFLKHFMMGPGQKNNCVGCAFEVDHLEGLLVHLENHDLSYVAVARAPIEEIEAYRKNMGWKFPWVSSYHSDFNYDFNVSFTASSSRRETRSTISARGNPGWKIFPATAFSSKTTQAKSFTPIQHLAAAASNFSALTAILTSRRKVAMRTARTIRWAIGCAPEICTVRAARSKAMEDFTRQGAAVRSTSKQPSGGLRGGSRLALT